MRRTLFGILLATMATASNAQNEGWDIGTLLEWCEADQGTVAHTYCRGRIEGVAHMMVINCLNDKHGTGSSPPHNKMADGAVSPAAMIQSFKNWAKDNPQRWSDMFGFGVSEALSQTWPCEY